MEYVRKAASCFCKVLKGMLFIGFSVQIILGIWWFCCHFFQVQSFGEPQSLLYRGLLSLLGGRPALLYSLQVAAAFLAGTLFLQNLRPVEPKFALWRGLAFVTIPFGMQCHLALLPYSFMSSLFVLFLLALFILTGNKGCRQFITSGARESGDLANVNDCQYRIRKKRVAGLLLGAFACAAAFAALSGALDPDKREKPGYSIEGALASRFAWPTLWNDYGRYGEEVRIVPEEVVWNASYHPDDMEAFQESLESQVGVETAKEYYLRMAKTGWDYHAPMIIRQIGWDALGYAVTPVIFPLQMAGEAYDSCSARNYEVMRENAPVLTRYYVDYGCWWFVWMLAISVLLAFCRVLCRRDSGAREERKKVRRKAVIAAGICCVISGLLIAVVTMRGAGKMDYRLTIGVNALWLTIPLLFMGRPGPGGQEAFTSLAGAAKADPEAAAPATAVSSDVSVQKGT